MTSLVKELYTASVTVTGGRRGGTARSSDGLLDVNLQAPPETGGPGGATNPEQLFAAAYAACYRSALGVVARRRGVSVDDVLVTADVTLGIDETERYGLRVRLALASSTMESATLQELGQAAHEVCPFSRAIAGNVEVATLAQSS
ncbi:MAG TPA: Ohr family peroxiredoxin [Natronosporangium sp.]